tara:strand:+ start:289 stop:933 length:645 start_codon:yes stop_codon:yes gene_type:complete
MSSPSYRNWLMCRNVRNKDTLVDAILDGYVDSESLLEARLIYEDKVVKAYVESCLLATEDFTAISDLLEIPKPVLMLYHDIYYDVHGLSKVYKVEHIANIDDECERIRKQWAFSQGLDYITWRMGQSGKLSVTETIQNLHSDAYYKAKEAFFSDSTSSIGQEGLKWHRQTVLLAKMLTELEVETDDVAATFELALKKISEKTINMPSIDDLLET